MVMKRFENLVLKEGVPGPDSVRKPSNERQTWTQTQKLYNRGPERWKNATVGTSPGTIR
jgi:hypothetical protein